MGIMSMLEGHSNNANQMMQNPQQNKGSLTHEVIAGAAAYEAMKAYENKRKSEGITGDHSKMREMVAAFAGAEVDKKFETGGLDYLDREKAKKQAQSQAVQAYDEQYAH